MGKGLYESLVYAIDGVRAVEKKPLAVDIFHAIRGVSVTNHLTIC